MTDRPLPASIRAAVKAVTGLRPFQFVAHPVPSVNGGHLEDATPGGVGGDDGVQSPWWAVGDPVLALVTADSDGAAVAAPIVTWYGHQPQLEHGPIVVVPLSDLGTLQRVLGETIDRRLVSFRRCIRCRGDTPPEWWHGEGHCQGCAARYLGAVY